MDWGYEKNMRLYGQSDAPDYDLSKIQMPIAIFSGHGDPLCVPEDVRYLA
jgi:hypothetical protein